MSTESIIMNPSHCPALVIMAINRMENSCKLMVRLFRPKQKWSLEKEFRINFEVLTVKN